MTDKEFVMNFWERILPAFVIITVVLAQTCYTQHQIINELINKS